MVYAFLQGYNMFAVMSSIFGVPQLLLLQLLASSSLTVAEIKTKCALSFNNVCCDMHISLKIAGNKK